MPLNHLKRLHLGAFGWFVLTLAGLSFAFSVFAVSSTWLRDPKPFFSYYEARAIAGTIDPENPNQIVRAVGTSGEPIFGDEILSFVAVRCGPEEETAVRSIRTWILYRPDGSRVSFEERSGIFDFSPIDGCAPLPFTVTVPEQVRNELEGDDRLVVAIDFDLQDREEIAPPVGVRTETFEIVSVERLRDATLEYVRVPTEAGPGTTLASDG